MNYFILYIAYFFFFGFFNMNAFTGVTVHATVLVEGLPHLGVAYHLVEAEATADHLHTAVPDVIHHMLTGMLDIPIYMHVCESVQFVHARMFMPVYSCFLGCMCMFVQLCLFILVMFFVWFL